MKVYLWLRNTHLWLGLVASLFILAYGVSAVRMAHREWLDEEKPVVTERRIPLDEAALTGARAAARLLMDVHDVRGDLKKVEESPRGIAFEITRPGTYNRVEIDRATKVATVRTTVSALPFTLNRIHQLHGFDHDYWVLNVWGVFVVFVSLGLIVLGVTGIYLWFKVSTERKVGLVLLIVSLGLAVPLIISIRIA